MLSLKYIINTLQRSKRSLPASEGATQLLCHRQTIAIAMACRHHLQTERAAVGRQSEWYLSARHVQHIEQAPVRKVIHVE